MAADQVQRSTGIVPSSPDAHAAGLLPVTVDPLRYDGHTADPRDAADLIASLVEPSVRVLDVSYGTGSLSRS